MSTDYGSYNLRGFWFQPDPVSMDEAQCFFGQVLG